MFSFHEPELSKIKKLLNYCRLSNNTLMAINRLRNGKKLSEKHNYSLEKMVSFFDQAIIGEEQTDNNTYQITSFNISSLNAYNRMTMYGLRDIINNKTEVSEIREFLIVLRNTLISFSKKNFDSLVETDIDFLINVLESLSESYSCEIDQITIEEVQSEPWQTKKKT